MWLKLGEVSYSTLRRELSMEVTLADVDSTPVSIGKEIPNPILYAMPRKLAADYWTQFGGHI